MSVELNKITGLMLPKHISDSCDCEDGEGCREYKLDPEDQGYDKAITQQGQKKIQLNREETARELYNLFRCPCGQSHISWENLKLHQRRYWDKKVDALDAKLERLLEDI